MLQRAAYFPLSAARGVVLVLALLAACTHLAAGHEHDAYNHDSGIKGYRRMWQARTGARAGFLTLHGSVIAMH